MIKNLLLIGLLIYTAKGLIKPPVYKVLCVGGHAKTGGYATACVPFLFTDSEFKEGMSIIQYFPTSYSTYSFEISRPGIFTSVQELMEKSKAAEIHPL